MTDDTIAGLDQLETASDADAIADACTLLSLGLKLPKYFYIHRRQFNQLGLVGHNAGDRGFINSLPLDASSDDPVVARPKARVAPFFWSEADYGKCGPKERLAFDARVRFGYRSGVCAYVGGDSGQSLTLVLASDDIATPAGDPVGTLGMALLGAGHILNAANRCAAPAGGVAQLTARERDCLLYVLAGASAKVTGQALCLAPRSVRQYLERARRRLGVENSFQAALVAARAGLVDIDEAKRITASIAADVGQT